MKNKNEQIRIYRSWFSTLERLPLALQGRILKAILHYDTEGRIDLSKEFAAEQERTRAEVLKAIDFNEKKRLLKQHGDLILAQILWDNQIHPSFQGQEIKEDNIKEGNSTTENERGEYDGEG